MKTVRKISIADGSVEEIELQGDPGAEILALSIGPRNRFWIHAMEHSDGRPYHPYKLVVKKGPNLAMPDEAVFIDCVEYQHGVGIAGVMAYLFDVSEVDYE